ncbi:MAG: hypothetical protein IKV06_02235 [Alistipes sp.]|nr:hypothetical protein [Alistipes sp.]
MMKLRHFCYVALSLVVFVGCGKDDSTKHKEQDKETIQYNLDYVLKEDNPLIYGFGGEILIPAAVVSGWCAEVVEEEDRSWLILSQDGDDIRVCTMANDSDSEREATIRFTRQGSEDYLTVRQLRNIIHREPISERRVRNELRVWYETNSFARAIAILPIPVSNLYQDISDLECYEGQVCIAEDGETKYLYRYIDDGAKIPASYDAWLSEEFTITNYSVNVDFDAITSYVEIDKESQPYLMHTGKSGSIIDPYNAEIVAISESLWAEANGDIVDYARLSYEWVAANMAYINPNTGLHPIADILANGGGDCGNQATVFNTLMRCIDVPARHVVMVRTDGTFHVRSEFYLAGYGWIPVDANAKNSIPYGDFFGKIYTNEIVVNSNINIIVNLDDIGFTELVLLQNFAAWYWWYRETPLEFYHTVVEI